MRFAVWEQAKADWGEFWWRAFMVALLVFLGWCVWGAFHWFGTFSWWVLKWGGLGSLVVFVGALLTYKCEAWWKGRSR